MDVASGPTGKAYGMVARRLSQLSGATAPDECERIGEQIGRLVFLVDADRDMKQDAGQTYNPLTQPLQAAPVEFSSQGRKELAEYVVFCLDRVELIVAEQGSAIAERWSPLRNQLLALFGLKASSVILNAQCCVPCCGGFVVADSNECDGCLQCCGLCILVCCAAIYCSD